MNEELRIALLGLLGVIIAISLVVLVVFIIKKQLAKKAFVTMPDNTEGKIERALRSYAAVNFCKVYTDFRFSYKEYDFAIGHLLVGEFGILGIDAIRYRGELYGALGDSEWTHYMGDEKETVPNASLSLEQAMTALRARLGQEHVFGMRMLSFCVSLDKKLEAYLPDAEAPVPFAELSKKLNSSAFTKKGHENVDALTKALEACMEEVQ